MYFNLWGSCFEAALQAAASPEIRTSALQVQLGGPRAIARWDQGGVQRNLLEHFQFWVHPYQHSALRRLRTGLCSGHWHSA